MYTLDRFKKKKKHGVFAVELKINTVHLERLLGSHAVCKKASSKKLRDILSFVTGEF